MIFIGYQGVGKSTLSKKDMRYIDLESGNFWVDGKRSDNWYEVYCNIAEDLSKNGYNVFVSSHKEVRSRLKTSTERVISIVPDPVLRESWLLKLQNRYQESMLSKDYKALMNAMDRFTENVNEIIEDASELIILHTANYSLALEILRHCTNT